RRLHPGGAGVSARLVKVPMPKSQCQMAKIEQRALLDIDPWALGIGTPSRTRAWLALVALSLRRQARARQMVWIALALGAFAVALVAVNTQGGRWGMHHWRSPRRVGPTYLQWVDRGELAHGVFQRQPGAHAIQHAFYGSCRAILHPEARA